MANTTKSTLPRPKGGRRASDKAPNAGTPMQRAAEAGSRSYVAGYAPGAGRRTGWSPFAHLGADMPLKKLRKHLQFTSVPKETLMKDYNWLVRESRWLSLYHPLIRQNNRVLRDWTVGSGFNHSYTLPADLGVREKAAMDLAMADVLEHMESPDIDGLGQRNIYALDRQVEWEILTSGSVIFVLRKLTFKQTKKLGMKVPGNIELYSPDFLPINGRKPDGVGEGNTYWNGHEFLPGGRLEAIWMYEKHPNDGASPLRRFPIRDAEGDIQCGHLLGDPDAIGAARGAPRAISVVETAYELAKYRASVLKRMQLDAKQWKWLLAPEGATYRPSMFEGEEDVFVDELGSSAGVISAANGLDQEGKPLAGAGSVYTEKDIEDITDSVDMAVAGDGNVITLPPGWKQETSQIAGTSGYPEFMRTLEITVCTGMGVPTVLGINDKGSFSSDKVSLAQFKIERQAEQQYLFDNWRKPIYRFMVKSAFAFDARMTRMDVSWTTIANPFPFIEPEREMNVLIAQMDALLMTFDEALVTLGKDPKVHKAALIAQRDFFRDELGITKPFGPGFFKSFGGAAPSSGESDTSGGAAAGKADQTDE